MKTNFKFLAAFTLLLGLFSCSSDDVSDGTNGSGSNGNLETYATIRVAMPNGNAAMGRATDPENGDGVEVGTEVENTFNSVVLYFFDGNTPASKCCGVLSLSKDAFSKTSSEGNTTITYQAEKQKVGIVGNDMYVYAVVNGNGVSGINVGTSLLNFLGERVNKAGAINDAWMLMSSRTPAEKVTITTANNSDNPAVLTVSVERTAAKITYKAENAENKYDIKDKETGLESVGEVVLTDYKLVNLRNDAYFFRKVAGSDGNWQAAADLGNGVQTSSNYVIDPYFTQKTLQATEAENFLTTWFGADKAYAENGSVYSALPKATNHTFLSYCMENTMAQAAQLNGFSTGIIFKATYKPTKVLKLNNEKSDFEKVYYVPGQTFYRYADAIYADKNEIIEFYKLGSETTLIDTYEGDGQLGAPCYYKYWIRHMDNKLPEQMGIMEFGIVRNNVYKLSVNKVSSLGEPTDVIIPNNPDETGKTYLTVNVEILPWVVRSNEGIEL